ncbi:hypothetical protein LTR74_018972, partial [Friedmanniomyces endolithicus]
DEIERLYPFHDLAAHCRLLRSHTRDPRKRLYYRFVLSAPARCRLCHLRGACYIRCRGWRHFERLHCAREPMEQCILVDTGSDWRRAGSRLPLCRRYDFCARWVEAPARSAIQELDYEQSTNFLH